jgi:S1-C subfamily serine protease
MRSLCLRLFLLVLSVGSHEAIGAHRNSPPEPDLRPERHLHQRRDFGMPVQPDPSKPFQPEFVEQRKIDELVVDGVCRSEYFSGLYNGVKIAGLVGCVLPRELLLTGHDYRIRMPAEVANQPLDKAEIFKRGVGKILLIKAAFSRELSNEEIAKLPASELARAKALRDQGQPVVLEYLSRGSGVAIGGWEILFVMTNCHVVNKSRDNEPFQAAGGIKIVDRSHRVREARLEAAYPAIDLCILTVKNADPLEEPEYKSADPYRIEHAFYYNGSVTGIRPYYDLQVGEPVFAIGNPVPAPEAPDLLTWSFSDGVITGLRDDTDLGGGLRSDVIQHNALINHGSSGGALFDQFGNLIGITQGQIGSEGFNLAIPADLPWVLYGKAR